MERRIVSMSQATNWAHKHHFIVRKTKDILVGLKTAMEKNKLVDFASSKLVSICHCQGKFIQIEVSVH